MFGSFSLTLSRDMNFQGAIWLFFSRRNYTKQWKIKILLLRNCFSDLRIIVLVAIFFSGVKKLFLHIYFSVSNLLQPISYTPLLIFHLAKYEFAFSNQTELRHLNSTFKNFAYEFSKCKETFRWREITFSNFPVYRYYILLILNTQRG